MPHEVKDVEEFEKLTKGKRGVVDFYASWCGPCKIIAPSIAQLESKFPDLVFLKVDVDKVPDLSEAYHIKYMPTFVFLTETGKEAVQLRVSGASIGPILKSISALNGK